MQSNSVPDSQDLPPGILENQASRVFLDSRKKILQLLNRWLHGDPYVQIVFDLLHKLIEGLQLFLDLLQNDIMLISNFG